MGPKGSIESLHVSMKHESNKNSGETGQGAKFGPSHHHGANKVNSGSGKAKGNKGSKHPVKQERVLVHTSSYLQQSLSDMIDPYNAMSTVTKYNSNSWRGTTGSTHASGQEEKNIKQRSTSGDMTFIESTITIPHVSPEE